jgi:hypothetical protein
MDLSDDGKKFSQGPCKLARGRRSLRSRLIRRRLERERNRRWSERIIKVRPYIEKLDILGMSDQVSQQSET